MEKKIKQLLRRHIVSWKYADKNHFNALRELVFCHLIVFGGAWEWEQRTHERWAKGKEMKEPMASILKMEKPNSKDIWY